MALCVSRHGVCSLTFFRVKDLSKTACKVNEHFQFLKIVTNIAFHLISRTGAKLVLIKSREIFKPKKIDYEW